MMNKKDTLKLLVDILTNGMDHNSRREFSINVGFKYGQSTHFTSLDWYLTDSKLISDRLKLTAVW